MLSNAPTIIPGAHYLGDGRCNFRVWAPLPGELSLQFPSENKTVPLEKKTYGYWEATLENIRPGQEYIYLLDGDRTRPDPASFFQPTGVHTASAVVDHTSFPWTDNSWKGIERSELVIYELHVGTFTPEGTFDAVIDRIDQLLDLGITAIELLPVAEFPGARNWGYDGVYPYAPSSAYGGPDDLKRLVNACHEKGMAILLDVVYNHLGPEGNYLWEFGPYFTNKYQTPWGWAINFDGPHSDQVRRYFIENAAYWIEKYHFDGLRFDAIHGIFDFSAKHILAQLTEEVESRSRGNHREIHLIAESDLNDRKVVETRADGGFGMHAQWMDDFHHALHTLVTGESIGYYEDFGSIAHLQKAYTNGYVYTWDYSRHRKRHFGSDSNDLQGDRFVVCIQNHDQIGNRMLGDRLTHLVPAAHARLAATALLWAPYVPLVFMGEEYAETSPFLYFVSHGDPQLVEAVREGRKNEFASFKWDKEPPDPQSETTFLESKLHWESRGEGNHEKMLSYYRELLRLRRETPALASLDKSSCTSELLPESDLLITIRSHPKGSVVTAHHFGDGQVKVQDRWTTGTGILLICSADTQWGGPGADCSQQTRPNDTWHIGPWSCISYLIPNE